jgi:hypothetical protein
MPLQSELHHGNKNKHQLLLQQLYKAHQEGKLSCGAKAVWNTATHRKGLLLVVEENYLKDLVDDIIEKVLNDGGDVEFVETGALSSFQQIALIEFNAYKPTGV